MAYNSLKRIFGETKLELKLLLLFGVGLLVIIVAAFYSYYKSTEKLVYEQNQNTGRLLVDQYMLTLHWGVMDSNAEDTRHLTFIHLTPDQERQQQDQTDLWVKNMLDSLTKTKWKPELIRPNRKEGGPGAPSDDFEREICKNRAVPLRPTTRARPTIRPSSRKGSFPTTNTISSISTSSRSVPSPVVSRFATAHRWVARGSTPPVSAFPWRPLIPGFRTAT